MAAMVETAVGGLSQGSQCLWGQGGHFIPCFRCGVCCIGHQVRLSLVEARRIADGLGVGWEEFLASYVDQRWPAAESFLLRQRNRACIFLEHRQGGRKASCLIHPFKPSACREWTPSLYRRECQAGLNKLWGLSVSPSGEPEGPEEKLPDFHAFLESLLIEGETYADLRVRM